MFESTNSSNNPSSPKKILSPLGIEIDPTSAQTSTDPPPAQTSSDEH